jgi:hypothetical protein
MTSAFDQLAADYIQPTLQEHMGESIIYRAPDADDVTVTAVLGEIMTTELDDGHGRQITYRRQAILGVDASTAEGGVANPRDDAVVVIGTDIWSVEHHERRGATAVLALVRDPKIDVTRPGYRARR